MFDTFTLERKFTYGQMFRLLRDFGFEDRLVTVEPNQKGHVFVHPHSNHHLIELAVHDPVETALPHDVAYVRRMLDAWEFMPTSDFDRWMAKPEQDSEPSKAG